LSSKNLRCLHSARCVGSLFSGFRSVNFQLSFIGLFRVQNRDK
jgi:hypothetical protein